MPKLYITDQRVFDLLHALGAKKEKEAPASLEVDDEVYATVQLYRLPGDDDTTALIRTLNGIREGGATLATKLF